MPGENTMTKLMASDDQLNSRLLAMAPVISRPSTLTVMVSPNLRPKASNTSRSSEISGGPR